MKKYLFFAMMLWLAILVVPVTSFAQEAVEEVLESEERVSQEIEEETAREEVVPPMDKPLSFANFRAYAEEKIFPVVIFVFTAIGTIYVAISPVLVKVKRASEKFKSATEDVNVARDESRKTGKEMKLLEEELRGKIGRMDEALQRLEQMMRVGFEHIPELVEGGYAREIERIVEKGAAEKEAEHGEAES